MLMKIAHHNDGKEKWQSHTCYLFNDASDYYEFDITNHSWIWRDKRRSNREPQERT